LGINSITTKLVSFLLVSLLVVPPGTLFSGQLNGKLTSIATEIATNPGGFLFDIYQMTESVPPTRVDRRFSIATGFMPALLPFTFANASARFSLTQEHPGIPQIEIFGGYSKLLALAYVNSDSTEGSVYGKHYGISVVQSIHPKARLQVALEHSGLTGKVNFKKKPLQLYGTSLTSIKVDLAEDFLLVGAEILRGERRYMFTQLGYGLQSSKIFARILWVGKHWDTGLTIYPESALVIYPTLSLRFGH